MNPDEKNALRNGKTNFKVSVFTPEEAAGRLPFKEDVSARLLKLKNAKFCKSEVHSEYLGITFAVPSKKRYQEKSSFTCLISSGNVYFIDDTGTVGACIKKMHPNKVYNEDSLGRFVYDFLETLIESDLRYLEECSDRITKIENAFINGVVDMFDHKMFSIRKEILTFYRYYSQLIDVGQELQENENGFFTDENLHYFKLFTERARQFYEETKTLREYTLQLRELQQNQIDIKQNKIMKVLTVVTTIFSPLTIIVGWYGMNFPHMPEFLWAYGYPYVILLSLAALAGSIWLLKKFKFL